MKLPNWFRILWWFLLTAGLTWVLYRRYPDLVAGHAAAVDVFVFAVWVALILVPLFHEVSFSGVKFWRKYDTSLRINSDAPNFTAETTQGTINFHQWIGDDWAILFSHPKDFTPVCTTELGDMARLKPEFDNRGCKIIGLSVDPVSQHGRWSKDIEETQGYAVNYPMIGDPELKVAKLYDMLPAEAGDTSDGRLEADNATVRSVFIIGPDKKIKATLTYPMSSGRNFDEVLRLLNSCQLSAKYPVATPVNWKQGEDVIIVTSVTDDQAKQRFPRGFRSLKPYLRFTQQLVAIMFTDIVGYSAMAQRDEGLTMELLDEHHSLLRPVFLKHQGQEVKTMGDGFLVEFASAVAAVNCAIELQEALARRNLGAPADRQVQVRIGIHLGDVLRRGDDIVGDGVNIAARVEPLADSGGIAITQQVFDQVYNKIPETLARLGKVELKNIQRPVEVYSIILGSTREADYYV